MVQLTTYRSITFLYIFLLHGKIIFAQRVIPLNLLFNLSQMQIRMLKNSSYIQSTRIAERRRSHQAVSVIGIRGTERISPKIYTALQ